MPDRIDVRRPTFVLLRERVCVYRIESPHGQELVLDKVLPLPFQNPHTWLVVPAAFSHVLSYVRMRLNDDVQRWRRRKRLEHAVNLKILVNIGSPDEKRTQNASRCQVRSRRSAPSSPPAAVRDRRTASRPLPALQTSVLGLGFCVTGNAHHSLMPRSQPIMTPTSSFSFTLTRQTSCPCSSVVKRRREDMNASVEPAAVVSVALKTRESGESAGRDRDESRARSSSEHHVYYVRIGRRGRIPLAYLSGCRHRGRSYSTPRC